ncbi:hypothetical protein Huta_0770 [Halorhabdus utahensis DSM 12940]|uniref:Uncharacterized protein n=1 Tax=Halorhabdus utahensis (strain DSM 12940 / JCM 11049 / AX-2) TaxID=519442 RepID=C7NTW6_HALUD|nr:hypothetical protein [Halorhabdus utahensis]ACV10955.1 hypothetical protein Huta_0770 [Halorhabdus utahensis DSM 12940]
MADRQRVRFVIGAIATAGLVAVSLFTDLDDPVVLGAVVLAYFGAIYGGTSLYLWFREERSVRITGRVRFLGALLVLLGVGLLNRFGPNGQIAGADVDAVLAWFGLAVLVVFGALAVRDRYVDGRRTELRRERP